MDESEEKVIRIVLDDDIVTNLNDIEAINLEAGNATPVTLRPIGIIVAPINESEAEVGAIDESAEKTTPIVFDENTLNVANRVEIVDDNASSDIKANNVRFVGTIAQVINNVEPNACPVNVDEGTENIITIDLDENSLHDVIPTAEIEVSNALPAGTISEIYNEPVTKKSAMGEGEQQTNSIVLKEKSPEEENNPRGDNGTSDATSAGAIVEEINNPIEENNLEGDNNPANVNDNPVVEISNETPGKPVKVAENEESIVSNDGIAMPLPDNDLQDMQADYVDENSIMLAPPRNVDISELNDSEEEMLRGDAVGSTTYSSRFLLSALLDLTKEIQEDITDSELENNLCILWDMAMEYDVVDYMLQFDVLDIFFILLEKTNDKRLTELLIGIIANMCNNKETITEIYSKHLGLVELLLQLCGCTDMRTLEQLMRLWSVIFSTCDTNAEIIQWYNLVCQNNDFMNGIISILTNGYNKTVLLLTMKTLYIFLFRYSTVLEKRAAKRSFNSNTADAAENNSAVLLAEFRDRFIRSDIVKATTEALQTFLTFSADDDSEEVDMFESYTKKRKAQKLFCYLHSIFTKYSPNTQTAYEGNYQEVSKCMQLILKDIYKESLNWFKLWDEYEMDILQGVTDFITIAPFDEKIIQLCAKIWYNIVKDIETKQPEAKKTNSNSFRDRPEDRNIYEDIAIEFPKNLFSLLMYCIRKAEKEDIKKCFDCIRKEIRAKLIKSLENMEATLAVRTCLDKLTV